MPWNSRIDTARRLIYTRVSGTLCYQDAVAHRKELAADPAFDAAYSHLLDLRDVDRLALSASDVIALASRSVLAPESRQAIVAPADAVFGTSRMYYAYRNQCPDHEDITVCRSIPEALSRLGLSDAPIS